MASSPNGDPSPGSPSYGSLNTAKAVVSSASWVFESVLFEQPHGATNVEEQEPACFHNLNLDLVAATLVTGRESYDLLPLFYRPLRDVGTLRYRQEALQELDREEVRAVIDRFTERMAIARRHHQFASSIEYRNSRNRWLHDAMYVYGEAVRELADHLQPIDLASRAFRGFREYLVSYIASESFQTLFREGQRLGVLLADIRYTVQIRGGHVTVRRYEEARGTPRTSSRRSPSSSRAR